jgi:hypothetical protein
MEGRPMSEHIVAPADLHLSHIELTPANTPKQDPQVPAEVSAEQIQAVDEAFKAQQHSDAAGLLMLWTSLPLMLEMAKDHFRKEEPEEEPRPQADEE